MFEPFLLTIVAICTVVTVVSATLSWLAMKSIDRSLGILLNNGTFFNQSVRLQKELESKQKESGY